MIARVAWSLLGVALLAVLVWSDRHPDALPDLVIAALCMSGYPIGSKVLRRGA